MPARRLRAAHAALAVTFVGLGAIDGTWAARLPALQQRLSLDSGKLGLVILAVSLSATVLLPVSGWLTSRSGSRGPTGLGLIVAAAGLTFTSFSATWRERSTQSKTAAATRRRGSTSAN